jgi:hypothetical protein
LNTSIAEMDESGRASGTVRYGTISGTRDLIVGLTAGGAENARRTLAGEGNLRVPHNIWNVNISR